MRRLVGVVVVVVVVTLGLAAEWGMFLPRFNQQPIHLPASSESPASSRELDKARETYLKVASTARQLKGLCPKMDCPNYATTLSDLDRALYDLKSFKRGQLDGSYAASQDDLRFFQRKLNNCQHDLSARLALAKQAKKDIAKLAQLRAQNHKKLEALSAADQHYLTRLCMEREESYASRAQEALENGFLLPQDEDSGHSAASTLILNGLEHERTLSSLYHKAPDHRKAEEATQRAVQTWLRSP